MGVRTPSRQVLDHLCTLSPSHALLPYHSSQCRPPPAATGTQTCCDPRCWGQHHRLGRVQAAWNFSDHFRECIIRSEDVADIAIGLLIDVQRKISAADRYLGGKRVGIIGLGNIGSEVAKRLKAFGCIVSYNSRRKKQALPYLFYSNVHELAANTDALIICCAFTDQTRHMINKEVLSALGREGVIVNVGRGAIIDEKELVRCLVHGEIGGAGLDVFENEPHVPQELFALDNVVLSPHKAALTPESFERSNQIVIANLEAFFSNKPLVTPFNG
ncbi:glyoxylate/hydroxypyruvate reductase HPR3 [Prunus yedoensis var. nudiflora]|uniref:glyoxylate reductase (NADP(+)) n=1 Tax=Prunus yedoensis var. nudiflora TaxID=2094558 RepID=A0A314ZJ59_PRUYE|nr:glyoxylate/hydroxypyruvate reductase HPR3 [Prunus yedoensis var. nudiflora]